MEQDTTPPTNHGWEPAISTFKTPTSCRTKSFDLCTKVQQKIYVAALEVLKKKERQDETQFTTKIGGKISLGPRLPVISF
jgi:hypothetical protein